MLVAQSEAFVVGRSAAQHAVRVSFGEVPDDATLERALRVLAALLKERHQRLTRYTLCYAFDINGMTAENPTQRDPFGVQDTA